MLKVVNEIDLQHYVAVAWESQDSLNKPNDLIEIYRLQDGAIILTREAHFKLKYYCLTKFSHHRLGIAMPSSNNMLQFDTVVYDLKAGTKIFSLKELGFEKVCHFELTREKIFFVMERTLYCGQFWP